MGISEIIANLSNMPLASEQEVRTKVAVPILESLGYSPDIRAEEFPVFMIQGRTQSHKVADIILFASSEYEKHKSNSLVDREWVYNHSLMIVELKKPSESIDDSIGQALSYTMWTRALFYIVTNGNKIVIYKLKFNRADECVLYCDISGLVSEWGKIEPLISYNVLKAEKQSLIDTDQNTSRIYDEYCLSRISINKAYQEWHAEQSFVSGIKSNYILHGDFCPPKADFYIDDILQTSKNILISAPSGYGKTYCINNSVCQYSLEFLERRNNKIPIVLQCSLWKRSFHSLEEGIYNELHYFIPSISLETVKHEISLNKFILFIDALDECTNDFDLLINEINRLALSFNFSIIITSKPNDGMKFLKSFETYSLNGLSEKQINDITIKVLGYNAWILHDANQNLRVLLHTPLFLSMYLIFLKEDPRREKPKNLATIYNYYINHLLTKNLIKKGINVYNDYSPESIKKILAITAYSFIEHPETSINLDTIILSALPGANMSDIRKLIFGSNILYQYDGIINFQFESIKEYFYSLYLVDMDENDVINYIDNNSNSDKSTHIILLMIGNLANENYQNRILNHLGKTNFALYIKCLKTRYNFSNKYMEKLTQTVCENLFRQIIESYESIIRTHFASLIDFFYPWTELDESKDKNDVLASIVGVINLETLYIDVSLGAISKENHINRVKVECVESKHPVMIYGSGNNQIKSPILSFSDNIINFGYDLKHYYNGIDCAREIAAQIVFARIKKILEEKNLFFFEHPYMQCHYIEQSLDVLPERVINETLKSDKSKLSLNNISLEELESLFKPVNNLGYKSVSFLVIWVLSNEIKNSSINPKFVLPPEGNHSAMYGKESWWIWEVHTIKSIKDWIISYYDVYQASYRYFVERLFPTLKNNMPLYYSGPLQFQVTIFTDDNESEYCSADYHVEVVWEPKRTEDECYTVVSLKKKSEQNRKTSVDFWEKSIKKLRFLGRKGYGLGISNHGISRYIGSPNDDYTIRNRVYKKITEELKIVFDM